MHRPQATRVGPRRGKAMDSAINSSNVKRSLNKGN